MRKTRAVVDTNIFISGLLIPRSYPYQVLRAWQRGDFILLVSQYLVDEITEVLYRPKFAKKYGITRQRLTKIEQLLSSQVEEVMPEESSVEVRDKKDQDVLNTAITAKAQYLITGDEDLLVLAGQKGLGKLQIVRPKDFLIL